MSESNDLQSDSDLQSDTSDKPKDQSTREQTADDLPNDQKALPPRPKTKTIHKILAIAMVLAAMVPWFLPSDVAKLIVDQKEILLGRYSIDRFSWLLFGTPLLLWIAILVWVRPRSKKLRWFRIIAVLISVSIVVVATDTALRFTQTPTYVRTQLNRTGGWPGAREQSLVLHRPINAKYQLVYTDTAATARTYPNAPKGFPGVEITLSTDKRGFRNQTDLDQYDIVTVGDSFTEGSRISDDEPWPVLLSEALGKNVYNLGISGASPRIYLDNFVNIGLALKPKIAIFMIYEGNDLRQTAAVATPGSEMDSGATAGNDTGASTGSSAGVNVAVAPSRGKPAPASGLRIRSLIKRSPTIQRIRAWMIGVFGNIGKDAPVPGGQAIAWMPVRIEANGATQGYAFTPKDMLSLDRDKQKFSTSADWRSTAKVLDRIREVCKTNKVRLFFVYAPSKAHVVLPLIRDKVSAKHLRAFAMYEGRYLPPADQLKSRFFQRLSAGESLVEQYCRTHDVGFVSPTKLLREHAAKGQQVYYTYDQHWTKLGHVAVAQALIQTMAQAMTPEADRENK